MCTNLSSELVVNWSGDTSVATRTRMSSENQIELLEKEVDAFFSSLAIRHYPRNLADWAVLTKAAIEVQRAADPDYGGPKHRNATINFSRMAALLLATISLLAHAHAGMIHVLGTAMALTDKSVTVKTTDERIVQVTLMESTTYESGSTPFTLKDLKVGDRVVIHAVKKDGGLQAHEVRFSHEMPASTH